MINMDFANIREYDGSKEKGFEELVCQLAHLNPPDNAQYFVRKEGDGGDAGVECYWLLNDGTEHAWQAKFFLNALSDNQWSQISKSVETALEKHPNLTNYYICLPRDWTDSRKKINEKAISSAWDKWVYHVENWKELAREKNMNVKFSYWCKHELSQMLQVDRPDFSGKALYWFNIPILTSDILVRIAQKSKVALGERFTPEFHVDLPIANQFDCLGNTKKWKKEKADQFSAVSKIREEYKWIFNKKIDLFSEKTDWIDLNESIEKCYYEFLKILNGDLFYKKYEMLLCLCEDVYQNLNKCNDAIYDCLKDATDEDQKKELRELSEKLRGLSLDITDVNDFLDDKTLLAGKTKSVLLTGEAGIGKSHLLCDLALNRLDNGLPTLFLLGQHYPGGNPFDFICSELGLPHYPYRTVLGALDSLGESKDTRFLIIIDAINEGVYKETWCDQIIQFLVELEAFPHIAVVLSCRSTYKDYLIPQGMKNLVELIHTGFSGYEHRAAFKYLAKQGISKPGTPILNPEFTNPLFLKTCCKALKEMGEHKFPKGLSGFNKLYHFYIESAEQVIKRKKKYRSGESVVEEVLKKFVNELYPNNISGVPTGRARELIGQVDPKPGTEEPLLDLLIDEGIFATDVIPGEGIRNRGIEVVRFTYERFSDYAIAMYLLDNCVTEEDVAKLFVPAGEIGKIISNENRYGYSGIIEALGIGIPEKFNKEFMEFIELSTEDEHEYQYQYSWFFNKTFKDVILWRSGESISPKSLEMLNELQNNNNSALDIVLALSTELDHPWNADYLDYILFGMKMPERDAFWSTYVGINDYTEKEYGEESVIRTLIDWALYADLEEIESEKLRLLALVLLWMTTTSNRKVRDQATKSLARVLFHIPSKIVEFIEKFDECDDVYLVERLYASIYGAVVHLDNDQIVKAISLCVFSYQFKESKPYPDILLRDYARGIMEFAYHNNLLQDILDSPDVFRPPYNSDWPIENPSLEEIEQIRGDEFSSSIKRSLMGFINDFGNYTMRCIHDWSPTPITEKKPQTGTELKRIFAQKLPNELRARYDEYLDTQMMYEQRIEQDVVGWLKQLASEVWEETNEDVNIGHKEKDKITEKDSWERLEEDIINILNDAEKEEFRWVSGLNIGDRPASFSKRWAQRWVCKKAHELGWSSELFSEFEKVHSNGGGYGREGARIERIGKKYQWIAFHELLARMADNLIWLDRGYSDLDDQNFSGPWQIHKRDIDPTLWIRGTGENGWEEQDRVIWWQPYKFTFVEDKLDLQMDWLRDRRIVPSFNRILAVINPKDSSQWLVLRGFTKGTQQPLIQKDIVPEQDHWFRINSIIVRNDDFESLKKHLEGKNYRDPDVTSVPSSGHQGFAGEYPWHPYYCNTSEWRYDEDREGEINVEYHVPICEYEWESGSVDHSIDDSIRFYMPSSKIINDLGLLKSLHSEAWSNGKGELIFLDPSTMGIGPSYALIKRDVMQRWLIENHLRIVWLIGGEKQLFTHNVDKFYGRLVFSGMFTLWDNEITGELWFDEERIGNQSEK